MEREFFKDIAGHPLSVVTERYERLGWGAHTGTKIKRSMLEKGLIEQEKVSVPKGSVTLSEFAEKGKDLIAGLGIEVKDRNKNASLTHEFYKELVARKYEANGYKVQKEYPIGGGKALDLLAEKGKERIAIEIETGKSDVKENIRKCKEAGFDEVVIIDTRNFRF